MSQKCLIWGTPAETGPTSDPLESWVRSSRAGGEYRISGMAATMIKNGCLDDGAKAKLTTVLVDRRHRGEDIVSVDSTLLEQSQKATEITHADRAMRLLRHIAQRESLSLGNPVSVGPNDPGALAHSESWTADQIKILLEHLVQEQWLKVTPFPDATDCTVTVSGHNLLEAEDGENPDTKQVFVAMWFGDDMHDAYEKGIKAGILDAGFDPLRIDEKKDANRIDDDIIAEIKQSLFVVADMTHGDDGVRGSVYFEAGFAKGRKLPVIYSCRKDCIDKLPFDTRQYHHIVWETPEALRRQLADRIGARIGSNNSTS